MSTSHRPDTMRPECQTEFRYLREQQQAANEQIRHDLEEIKHAVIGNGEEGLRLKVDRLEQNEGRRVWYFRAITVAVVGVALKIFWPS